jgi:hypothetical protein
MVLLRITPCETKGNLEFDSQEVENTPSSRLGKARQHKHRDGTAEAKFEIYFFGGVVAIVGTALSKSRLVSCCENKENVRMTVEPLF